MVQYMGLTSYSLQKSISLKVNFVLANSADPDEMPFHLGLHCWLKYSFKGFRSAKG